MHGPTPLERMRELLTGYWTSQALYVAAKLGVADRLCDGPRTADELAGEVNHGERVAEGPALHGIVDL